MPANATTIAAFRGLTRCRRPVYAVLRDGEIVGDAMWALRPRAAGGDGWRVTLFRAGPRGADVHFHAADLPRALEAARASDALPRAEAGRWDLALRASGIYKDGVPLAGNGGAYAPPGAAIDEFDPVRAPAR